LSPPKEKELEKRRSKRKCGSRVSGRIVLQGSRVPIWIAIGPIKEKKKTGSREKGREIKVRRKGKNQGVKAFTCGCHQTKRGPDGNNGGCGEIESYASVATHGSCSNLLEKELTRNRSGFLSVLPSVGRQQIHYQHRDMGKGEGKQETKERPKRNARS